MIVVPSTGTVPTPQPSPQLTVASYVETPCKGKDHSGIGQSPAPAVDKTPTKTKKVAGLLESQVVSPGSAASCSIRPRNGQLLGRDVSVKNTFVHLSPERVKSPASSPPKTLPSNFWGSSSVGRLLFSSATAAAPSTPCKAPVSVAGTSGGAGVCVACVGPLPPSTPAQMPPPTPEALGCGGDFSSFHHGQGSTSGIAARIAAQSVETKVLRLSDHLLSPAPAAPRQSHSCHQLPAAISGQGQQCVPSAHGLGGLFVGAVQPAPHCQPATTYLTHQYSTAPAPMYEVPLLPHSTAYASTAPPPLPPHSAGLNVHQHSFGVAGSVPPVLDSQCYAAPPVSTLPPPPTLPASYLQVPQAPPTMSHSPTVLPQAQTQPHWQMPPQPHVHMQPQAHWPPPPAPAHHQTHMGLLQQPVAPSQPVAALPQVPLLQAPQQSVPPIPPPPLPPPAAALQSGTCPGFTPAPTSPPSVAPAECASASPTLLPAAEPLPEVATTAASPPPCSAPPGSAPLPAVVAQQRDFADKPIQKVSISVGHFPQPATSTCVDSNGNRDTQVPTANL